ncbi:hypothetical protein NIES4071_26450 [Calothrix sp. NIES-4071]|nr:hypothetical protein NIES4071_26450 [Calothrix sp. NIES-4071]BAZ56967.1 hypothetical protein NIES4105_26390 [Calothrix sp. NIES-4105]
MRSLLGFILTLSLVFAGAISYAQNSDYEIWMSDQGNTQGITATNPKGSYGGKVRIYSSKDLEKNPPIDNPLVLDVATDLFPTALQTTGDNVNRIHGILPAPDYKYVTLNFVASGHLGIVNSQTKKPICLFRTTQTNTGRQNHMSFVAHDGSKILLANQNGKVLERVDVTKNNQGKITGFQYNADASLDLVGGTGRILGQPIAVDVNPFDDISCTKTGVILDGQSTITPNGIAKQAANIRSNNTVICPIISDDSQYAYATLGGGGMFVVDINATPMQIVAEYDVNTVHSAGCGGHSVNGSMYLNTGTPAPNNSEFTVYQFTQDYKKAPNFDLPNQPSPIAVWADPDNGKILPGNNRDAHGLVVTKDKYLHQFDRVRNNVEVFRADKTLEYKGSYSLKNSGACKSTLNAVTEDDPTPDLADLDLKDKRIYIALRGTLPQSVAHAAVGSCPGLGIIEVENKKSGRLAHVLPTFIESGDARDNLSDPHAVILVKS